MRLKKQNKYKEKTVAFRVTDRDLNKIKIKAGLYTDGNISEWVTYAALKYRPMKDEIEK